MPIADLLNDVISAVMALLFTDDRGIHAQAAADAYTNSDIVSTKVGGCRGWLPPARADVIPTVQPILVMVKRMGPTLKLQ